VSDTDTDFAGVADQADELTMDRARQRVERVRMGDVMIRLTSADGGAVRGEATIRHVRHHFPFGAALSHAHRLDEDDEAYAAQEAGLEAAADLFTMATINCHWGLVEPAEGTYDWSWTDRFVEWAEAHDMRMRLHALLYMNRGYTPRWRDEVASTDEWWTLIERRIAAVAERYGDRIHEYDVINEMFITDDWVQENVPHFPRLADPANAERVFRIARRHLPDATLIPLEQFIPTRYEGNTRFHSYHDYCAALIAREAPLDAIGYQGHFYTPRPTFRDGTAEAGPDAFRMSAIEGGLDHLAELGRPIHITEFNPPSRNAREPGWPARLSDQAVADWTVNYYTLAFSKPYIDELVRWFVIDAVGGRGLDAGLVTQEGEKKPAYWALKELLQETWSTAFTGTLGDGPVRLRGYHGTYRVDVEGHAPATFDLTPDSPAVIDVTLGPEH
jgi:endo-1,4-beta-xylanase